MSREWPQFESTPLRVGDPRYEVIEKTKKIAHEVKGKMTVIELNEYSVATTTEERLDWTISVMRRKQLEKLSSAVFHLIVLEDHVTGVAIDTSTLLTECTVPGTGLLTAYSGGLDEETRSAVAEGERQGTQDLLKRLVPEEYTDPFMRSLYFSAWRRDLMRRRGHSREKNDGTMRASLPTRVPGLFMDFHYRNEENFPVRTIYLSE